jgi:hypothetical protein
MNIFSISSNYGHIHLGPFYIGWSNHPRLPMNDSDCGDETFGFGIFNYYVGHYSDGTWCSGFLNKYGCLD